MMDFEQIRQYWEQRAAADASAQSTTQDVYLREIEFRALHDQIAKHRPRRVMDVGCGDARTTIRLARAYPATEFVGGDYSASMVKNAEANVVAAAANNVRVSQFDVTEHPHQKNFDLVYTTRCLINLPTWELQQKALQNIRGILTDKTIYPDCACVLPRNLPPLHQAARAR